MESAEDLKNKKTRYRVPTVCTVCRRRKIKCDKQRPHCVSCVKNRTTHMCHYEEQPWAADNEVQKLKEQVFQLQHQNNELKNLLNKRPVTAGANGTSNIPQLNTGLILPDEPSNDPVLELTNSFDLLMLKENKMAHYGSSSYMAVVSQDPVLRNVFKKFINAQMWGINLEKFFLYDQGVMPLHNDGCGSLAPNTPASVFEPEINKNHEILVAQINESLPDRDIMFALVDHFFSEAYAFVPYVDEESFRKNMESLVSTLPSGKASLVVTNISQLVTVATMLTVLRFSFLSLPMKKALQSHNHVVQKILDSNVQVPPQYVEFAKACMGNASALRRPTLKHIQALLLLRLYRYYSPEDGDESSDSTIFLALIVQMAKMHGMHRDPSRFPAVRDAATANIWRKMWVQLMYLDAAQALTFGCPLLIDDEYDTELPIPTSADSAMEKNCMEYLIKMNEVTQLMKSLVRASSSINTYPKRSEIEKTLRDVEYVLLKYRSLEELTSMYNPAESFLSRITKVNEFSLKLMLYNVYSVFYYILMLTCDSDELFVQQRYTTRAAESAFIIFRVCHDYAKSPHRYMKGLNSEIFLSAMIFELSKRCLQQMISLCFRDLSGMFNLAKIIDGFTLPDSQGLMAWFTPFSNTLTVADQGIVRLQEYVQSCSRMSNRYFVCWRIVFINKTFEDYIESQFPGKFDEIHRKVQQFNSSNQDNPIELDVMNVHNSVDNENDANPNASEVFQQMVDAGNQSKFDYLVPDLNKFNGFGEPFYDNMVAETATFEDFNSFLQYSGDDGPLTFGSFVSSTDRGGSTSDDVSPKTDSSDGQSLKHTQDDSPDIMSKSFTPGSLMNSTAMSEEDLAMQVAQSMFGGPSDIFGSSSINLGL